MCLKILLAFSYSANLSPIRNILYETYYIETYGTSSNIGPLKVTSKFKELLFIVVCIKYLYLFAHNSTPVFASNLCYNI